MFRDQVYVLASKDFFGFLNQTDFFVSLEWLHKTTGLYVDLSSYIIGKFCCVHKEDVFIMYNIVAGLSSLQLPGGF